MWTQAKCLSLPGAFLSASQSQARSWHEGPEVPAPPLPPHRVLLSGAQGAQEVVGGGFGPLPAGRALLLAPLPSGQACRPGEDRA